MYIFPGPSPDRTGTHEALITLHELGHYLTNRLIGNGNGLGNTQGRAMGEGWGDLLALCMTSQPGDDFANGCFAQPGWCVLDVDKKKSFVDNYYYGLRRYPYSARTDKNPLSFRHISKGAGLPGDPPSSPARKKKDKKDNPEQHNAGEVWCSALWEVFTGLVARHGHTYGERRMLHYVIGGLQLTPNQPTFLQARDAIVAAVTAFDRTDLRAVWAGFAKRGMGINASGPESDSEDLKGVLEGHITPDGLPDDTRIADLCAIDLLL
jgi:hypothetical protein